MRSRVHRRRGPGSFPPHTDHGPGIPAAARTTAPSKRLATLGSMVDRKPGEARDTVRDSHHPIDILTRNAIPASFGLEQAGGLLETDKTKWFIWVSTAGWLIYTECDIKSTCFAVGWILAGLLSKVSRVFPADRMFPILSADDVSNDAQRRRSFG